MWNLIKSLISPSSDHSPPWSSEPISPTINPATGLPMVRGVGSVDVQGNPYGLDLHNSSGMYKTDISTASSASYNSLSDDPFQNPLAGSGISHDSGFSSHSAFDNDTFSHAASSFSDDSWSSTSHSSSDDWWSSSSTSVASDSWSSSSTDFGSGSSWE